MNTINPTIQIRKTCNDVVKSAKHVTICDEAISNFANQLHMSDFEKLRNGVDWDACAWHYCADVATIGPMTCQYVFVLDALNFCFWQCSGLEYDTLAMSLKSTLERNTSAFDASHLLTMSEETLASWFPADLQLPQLCERVDRLRELGQVLSESCDGLASNFVAKADHSAVRLVRLLIEAIPGFRDTAIYEGRLVHLYKRAQILVGDLWAAYGRQTDLNHPYCFTDMDQLTMFADYRVPQILRHLGIMVYTPALCDRVDTLQEICFGSEEEVEIRAATVIAVDRLHIALRERDIPLLVIEVDWLLWQKGEEVKDQICPHHRTKTIYY